MPSERAQEKQPSKKYPVTEKGVVPELFRRTPHSKIPLDI